MLLEDWRIGLAFTVFTALTLSASTRCAASPSPTRRKCREAIADLFGYLEERLAGTEDIRSSGAVDFVILGIYKLSVQGLRTLAQCLAPVHRRALDRRHADDIRRGDFPGARLSGFTAAG